MYTNKSCSHSLLFRFYGESRFFLHLFFTTIILISKLNKFLNAPVMIQDFVIIVSTFQNTTNEDFVKPCSQLYSSKNSRVFWVKYVSHIFELIKIHVNHHILHKTEETANCWTISNHREPSCKCRPCVWFYAAHRWFSPPQLHIDR